MWTPFTGRGQGRVQSFSAYAFLQQQADNRSLLLWACVQCVTSIVWAQLLPIVCWFYRSALGLIPFQMTISYFFTPKKVKNVSTLSYNVAMVSLRSSDFGFSFPSIDSSGVDAWRAWIRTKKCWAEPVNVRNNCSCGTGKERTFLCL